MLEDKKERKRSYDKKALIIGGLAGIIVGAVLFGVIIFAMAPHVMIVTKECKLGFDETIAALREAVPRHGWVVSQLQDMNKSLAKHSVQLGPRVQLIELCHPEYAKSVLTTDRYISTMMPCSFSVWEGDDGKVYLSRMNIGLLAGLFGGNIARVMGDKVRRDEEAILAGILKE